MNTKADPNLHERGCSGANTEISQCTHKAKNKICVFFIQHQNGPMINKSPKAFILSKAILIIFGLS